MCSYACGTYVIIAYGYVHVLCTYVCVYINTVNMRIWLLKLINN